MSVDWNIARAHADNLELELHPAAGLAVRLLGYANHANMGSYDEAIQGFLAGHDPKPDVTAYREPGRVKTGAGANVEYAFPRLVRVFARTGWNEGNNESFAYTEVNNSVQGGGDLSGVLWKRSLDRLGVAVVSNGLSAPHREYLALGRPGVSPWRRHVAIRPRKYPGDLLHRASLAGSVGVGRPPVHRPSRLQPGSVSLPRIQCER